MSEFKLVGCDRCGRQEKSVGVDMLGRLVLPDYWMRVDSRDLCPECYGAFREWMRDGKRLVGAKHG